MRINRHSVLLRHRAWPYTDAERMNAMGNVPDKTAVAGGGITSQPGEPFIQHSVPAGFFQFFHRGVVPSLSSINVLFAEYLPAEAATCDKQDFLVDGFLFHGDFFLIMPSYNQDKPISNWFPRSICSFS